MAASAAASVTVDADQDDHRHGQGRQGMDGDPDALDPAPDRVRGRGYAQAVPFTDSSLRRTTSGDSFASRTSVATSACIRLRVSASTLGDGSTKLTPLSSIFLRARAC